MEYEFIRDFTGLVQARFSMGHEAMGAWLQEEISSRVSILPELYRVIEQLQRCERWEYVLDGSEYSLRLGRTEAEVVNSRVDFDLSCSALDDMAEDMDWYDQESRCSCGLDDFLAILKEWERFIIRR